MKPFLLVVSLVIYTNAVSQPEAQEAFNRGTYLLKSKNFQEAEKFFDDAIEKGASGEGVKMAYIYKGFALNGQEKFDDAISCFSKAIELDPSDPASFTDRALAYSYKKDYTNALMDFKHVLSLDSTGSQAEAAYFYLGKISMLTYKNKDAIPYFTKLLELVPTDSEAYFLRGTAKSNIMDSDGAIADFDKAIDLKPDYKQAYANRGVQKINKIPVDQKIGVKVDCFEDPCADLLKAKQLGDNAVDDMIYLYCKKCK